MLVTTEICCDLSCQSVPPHIYSKQNDKDSRKVKVSFTYCGETVDLSSVSRSEIRVQKPDGTLTVSSGETPENGTVTFPLSQDSLSAAGLAMVDFLLYGSDGSIISAAPAAMTVTAAAVSSASSSSSSGSGSTTDSELESEFKEFKQYCITQFTAITASLDSITERLGGLSFEKITESEYAAITPDSDTIYFITDSDGNIIKHNAGAVALGSGVADVVAVAATLTGTAVAATEITDETS